MHRRTRESLSSYYEIMSNQHSRFQRYPFIYLSMSLEPDNCSGITERNIQLPRLQTPGLLSAESAKRLRTSKDLY